MHTPDGWVAEANDLDARPCLRGTPSGYLHRGSNGWRHGILRTPAQARELRGPPIELQHEASRKQAAGPPPRLTLLFRDHEHSALIRSSTEGSNPAGPQSSVIYYSAGGMSGGWIVGRDILGDAMP
jgi:hypothetical protein